MKKTVLTILLILGITAQSAFAQEYDLDQFLDLVKLHSKNIKLAEQDIAMAKAMKKEAVSGALPYISGFAGYDRNFRDIYSYFEMGDEYSKIRVNRKNDYYAGVALNQTLLNGTVFNAIKAAKQYEKMTDFIYEASVQEILTYAKKAYHQTILLKNVRDIAAASEANALENYRDVQKAFDIGLVSEFSLLQAEVRHKGTIPQTTEAEKNYRLALSNIKNMAGIPSGEKITLSGDLSEYPALPPDESLENILAQRPDYAALSWEEKLLNTNVSANKAAHYPSLTGSLSYQFSAQSDEWAFEERNNTLTAGVYLNIPIFSGGATRARVQQARVDLEKSRISLARTRDDIETEVLDVRLRLTEARNRIESAQATLQTARKAFSIAEINAKAGLITQLNLKDSRITLDQAQVNYLSALYEYLAAYYDWEKTIGQAG